LTFLHAPQGLNWFHAPQGLNWFHAPQGLNWFQDLATALAVLLAVAFVARHFLTSSKAKSCEGCSPRSSASSGPGRRHLPVLR